MSIYKLVVVVCFEVPVFFGVFTKWTRVFKCLNLADAYKVIYICAAYLFSVELRDV